MELSALPNEGQPGREGAASLKQGFWTGLWAALSPSGLQNRLDQFLSPPCDCQDCKQGIPVWDRSEAQPLGFEWGKVGKAEFSTRMAAFEEQLADPEARVQSRYSLGGGINRTQVVMLDNGAVGVWKPASGQKMGMLRQRVDPGREPQREAAAYLVDKAMGHYARVPPSLFRTLEGEEGSLTLLVPDSKTAGEERALRRLANAENTPAYRRIALLDHVIGNLDRHKGNWLAPASADGKMDVDNAVPIDHGLSFPRDNGPQGEHNFAFDEDFRLQDEELTALQTLQAARPELARQTGNLISAQSLTALYERVEAMLQDGETSQSWRGVPSVGRQLLTALFNPRRPHGMRFS